MAALVDVFVGRVVCLAEQLRAAGFDVSTGEVIDATDALRQVGVGDRTTLRTCLRAAMVKEADPGFVFDRCFDAAFAVGRRGDLADDAQASSPDSASVPPLPNAASAVPGASGIGDEILRELLDGDDAALAALAAQAVGMYAGIDDAEGSEKYFLHRVLRAIDLSHMLSAAMRQLRREGDLTEFELMLQRNEVTARIEEFRRRLAAEIAKRLMDRHLADGVEIPERTRPEDVDILSLNATDAAELRRMLQPILRRIAARMTQKRKLRSTGRADLRRTIRRSLGAGGVPLDVVHRRRHPHRPEVVVLCDCSGSVAEFAQFTFALINALHEEVRRVRSFAFVDGIAEVTDVFKEAKHDIPVNRFVERKGVVGLDGHSDYGAVFAMFERSYLDDAIGSGTTVIVTGDARGNYRDAGSASFARIAQRARRVYWLNPEPVTEWGDADSLIEEYRRHCTNVVEVRTLTQLADAVAELV